MNEPVNGTTGILVVLAIRSRFPLEQTVLPVEKIHRCHNALIVFQSANEGREDRNLALVWAFTHDTDGRFFFGG